MTRWDEPPQALHVVTDAASARSIVSTARDSGARIISVDLSPLGSEAELEQLLRSAFKFPYPSRGFDAVISLMSDLEWMPSPAGYLFLADGLDESATEVVRKMADILPFILDRWRSGGQSFVAVLASDSSRGIVRAAVSASNAELDDFGARPRAIGYTAAVSVLYDA